MNIGIYRLVFNASRGIWMAVSEHVRSHQSGKSVTKTSKRKQSRQRATIYILLLGVSALNGINIAFAETIAPNTIPNINMESANIKGNFTFKIPDTTPNILNITQSSVKGIINIPKTPANTYHFNIGKNGVVNLNHTGGAGSATLFRVNGPKSIIEGALNAPKGKVYLINQNGILFGDGARVNVGGLVASALDMKDTDFLSQVGDFNAINDGLRPAYVWGGDGSQFQS
jgi:filamentous hemagglutinin family protein